MCDRIVPSTLSQPPAKISSTKASSHRSICFSYNSNQICCKTYNFISACCNLHNLNSICHNSHHTWYASSNNLSEARLTSFSRSQTQITNRTNCIPVKNNVANSHHHHHHRCGDWEAPIEGWVEWVLALPLCSFVDNADKCGQLYLALAAASCDFILKEERFLGVALEFWWEWRRKKVNGRSFLLNEEGIVVYYSA